MSENKYLYKIEELPVIQYLLRFIMFGWIYFAYTKFVINPIFFGFTIIVAVVIILSISESSVVATESQLIFINKRWLPFLNTTKRYFYAEITDIHYERRKTDGIVVLLNLIQHMPGTRTKPAQITIFKKDGSSIKNSAIGRQVANDELMSIVKGKIN